MRNETYLKTIEISLSSEMAFGAGRHWKNGILQIRESEQASWRWPMELGNEPSISMFGPHS
jgi:hypothetical protein